ncbi:MAG: rhodanese-like domain-containing protein [Desulfobacterales bacterium]
MARQSANELTAGELQGRLSELDEKDYLLIDVRQPHEYAESHLPGARLIPLLEFEAKLFSMPFDRELIFICHSGSRSRMAALLAEEAGITTRPIHNLAGGMAAWEGRSVDDFPKVEIFENLSDAPKIMEKAMDLEKGAFRFYRILKERFPDESFAGVIRQLEKEEEAHARLVHSFWGRIDRRAPEFDAFFASLEGRILEGGLSFESAVERIRPAARGRCIPVIELALDIETTAYDLYRNLAEVTADEVARDAFLSIAQAEKSHMKRLAGALADCTGSSRSDPQSPG